MLHCMKSCRALFAIVLVLGGCSDSGDQATGSESSSDTGAPESSSGVETMTDPTLTTADSSGDTTCSDGCTSSGVPTSGGSSSGGDTSTTGSEEDSSSSDGDPEESSSSEGTPGVCGNGVLEADEDCDDSGESADCDDDCTFSECGDDNLNV